MRGILMKCGHTTQATNGQEKPVCIICAGMTPDSEIIAESKPDLTGRKARCSYFGKTFKHSGRMVTCHGEADSKFTLAFFEHKPKSPYDKFYCGCWGWD